MPDWTPFNKWQMRNCTACKTEDPCPFREQTYRDYKEHGPAAIAGIPECPEKVAV